MERFISQCTSGKRHSGKQTKTPANKWIKVSTLDKGNPLLIPVKLADSHKEQLTDPETGKRRKVNRSVTLNRREDAWWLTLTYDETVSVQTEPSTPVIGVDVGIANFITTSTGQQYGSFNGRLRERQKRDREKRRRKAKLRKCLEKRGVPKDKLPSTSSATGQRLIRHVKQEINRAVNLCFEEHEGCQFAYEQLSVASMRHKARAMNAYMRASNFAHIPDQIAWNGVKRGVQTTRVTSAYSSQECHVCHSVDRKNRPHQQQVSASHICWITITHCKLLSDFSLDPFTTSSFFGMFAPSNTWKSEKMPTTSQEQCLTTLTHITRIAGKPSDPYEAVFVNQHGSPVVPLTEWYRLRNQLGPASTRSPYFTCLLPFLSFLEEHKCPWNASPQQLRPVIIAFDRDQLGCQIHPGKNGSVEVVPTRDTPLRPSTLRVLRAALRDFSVVLKDAGLDAFANPLPCEVLIALKREQMSTLANRGAPDHAGIREETHEQSRRRSTAFLRHAEAQGWKPEGRKELADVRQGIHAVLNAFIDSREVSPREKAVLEVLQNTGARLHDVVLMTVGGYRNPGLAGQAQVVNKGSYGREIKTIYFRHNPKVEQALTTSIDQIRPLHDPQGRKRLSEVDDHEPLFLTERGTPYTVQSFYYHWYRHYKPLQNRCPVRFSPHDLRQVFVSAFLIRLKLACGAGTDHFDAERYLREREAFGDQVMCWHSAKTIDIYDQTRDGERVLSILASYQHDLSERPYVPELAAVAQEKPPSPVDFPFEKGASPAPRSESVIWTPDVET